METQMGSQVGTAQEMVHTAEEGQQVFLAA